jgi:hypothetical protein
MTDTISRSPTNEPVIALRLTVVACMLAAVPLAFIPQMAMRPLSTPTSVVAVLWILWGVPCSALLAGQGERAVAKFLVSLAGGWSVTLRLACGIVLLRPVYSPHEMLTFGTMMLAACSQVVWCSFVVRRAPGTLLRGSVPVLVVSAAVLCGHIAWTNYAPPIATELPLDARAVRQHSSFSMVGVDAWFVTAEIREPEFRAYVRALGLSRCPAQSDWDFFRFGPEWFDATRTTEVWYDPHREAQSDVGSWTWMYVAWDGRTAWASQGAEWL